MTETNNNQPATKGDLALLKTDITDLRTELKTDIKNLTTTVNSLGVDVAKNTLRMDTLEHNMMEALRSFKRV